MADFPKTVHIVEEGPREGFQFERQAIPTARKIELIEALAETGLDTIQAVSFVDPRRVPGWADADAVAEGLTPRHGIAYTALWLNEKGLLRAIEHRDRLTLSGSISLCARRRPSCCATRTAALRTTPRSRSARSRPVGRTACRSRTRG